MHNVLLCIERKKNTNESHGFASSLAASNTKLGNLTWRLLLEIMTRGQGMITRVPELIIV